MNEEEITALAREYAQEKCGKENESPMYYGIAKNEMEEKLRWLSSRFCLVEKEKLKAIRFRKVYSAEDVRSKFTEECLLDALFPEIAKEVKS